MKYCAPFIRPVRRTARRAFNLVELLLALAISSALLTATMVALDASFTSYQQTTEEASTNTISRMVMHRILSMVRSGEDFGPFPGNPLDRIIESDFIQIRVPNLQDPDAVGELIEIEWREDDEALFYIAEDGTEALLLEGVVTQLDGDGNAIPPFVLEYDRGRTLYRATIDLTVIPDDNMDVEIDGENVRQIRLVASAMPRNTAFEVEE